MRHTEIIAPIGDGTWWLVQCHTCRTLWPAVSSRHRAVEVRDAHEADHAAETVTTPRLARLHASLEGRPDPRPKEDDSGLVQGR